MLGFPMPLAGFLDNTLDYVRELFAGVAEGQLLSIAVVGILALVLLRFVAARWVFTLAKQLLIFGGLAFAVWWSGHAVEARYGALPGRLVLYVGFAVVGILLFAMLYMFFLRRSRGETQDGETVEFEPGRKTMRVGAGPLKGQGLPVHRQSTPATATRKGTPEEDTGHTRVEDVLQKINLLGAKKDQNLLTVMVLILVAEFGVFTSKTIAAPNAQIGMVIFIGFIAAAVIFVKTSYEDYMRGVTHFVFATIFAVGLSIVMLVYWQQWCDPGTANATAECVSNGGGSPWARVLDPGYYFASDGLIAAITGVAFGTLLTKSG